MVWLVASFGIFMTGAVLCLILGRATVRWLGPVATIAGAAFGAVPVTQALWHGSELYWDRGWAMPLGAFHFGMDALSAWFAGAILLLSSLAAVYASGYLRDQEERRSTGVFWFHYLLLVASMIAVVTARNGILFLLAWEAMALTSFFLVIFDHEEESVRRAGWIYLVATHVGTAFILVLFALLGRASGSLDFAGFGAVAAHREAASVVFVLAIIGFGTKAGFMPLHVWLPEAHPAAPSPVSALLSGVMIKTGIYGLVRVLTFLGTPPAWWGWLLIAIGAVSGILGVLFALAQSDLKRLLAFSSVENMGIVTMGLGVGLLGISARDPVMAILGFSGALLHVLNHAVFKGLLFLGAGAVVHATGLRNMESLGGLYKRMPFAGTTFLVGSAAISGLPPLAGFVSEFLIYVAAFAGIVRAQDTIALSGAIVTVGALALIGGLALACFAKAFGVIFLGEPRSEQARHAHPTGRAMRFPMLLLAILCLALGLGGPFLLPLLATVTAPITGLPPEVSRVVVRETPALSVLWMLSAVTGGLILLAALLYALRARLLSGREIGSSGTWDCGYVAPTARMQYTASSFADPVLKMFGAFMGTRSRFNPPEGLFPEGSSFSSETPDVSQERIYTPLFSRLEQVMARLRMMQHGLLHLYILMIVVSLLALLVWKLG
ncbi:hypothetical protein KKD52_13505 [Myxococcota bacterium]|nr:hypothetical protein [Myxococcota bacterium]MBU1511370.1 hypothetical protein [Myxococcota bacterium]